MLYYVYTEKTKEERNTMTSYSRFNAVNCNPLARSMGNPSLPDVEEVLEDLGWKPSPVDLKRLYACKDVEVVEGSDGSDHFAVRGYPDAEVKWDAANMMYCEV